MPGGFLFTALRFHTCSLKCPLDIFRAQGDNVATSSPLPFLFRFLYLK